MLHRRGHRPRQTHRPVWRSPLVPFCHTTTASDRRHARCRSRSSYREGLATPAYKMVSGGKATALKRSPARIEILKAVRNASDVGQQLLLQAGRRTGGKIYFDRVGKPAKSFIDRPRDLTIGAARGEDMHDLVRHFAGHRVPAARERHRVQLEPELVEPVQ